MRHSTCRTRAGADARGLLLHPVLVLVDLQLLVELLVGEVGTGAKLLLDSSADMPAGTRGRRRSKISAKGVCGRACAFAIWRQLFLLAL